MQETAEKPLDSNEEKEFEVKKRAVEIALFGYPKEVLTGDVREKVISLFQSVLGSYEPNGETFELPGYVLFEAACEELAHLIAWGQSVETLRGEMRIKVARIIAIRLKKLGSGCID